MFKPLTLYPGGYSVQKILQGRATKWVAKSASLTYEWPLMKFKIWYMNGSICQNFPNLKPKLAQIEENFGKLMWFCSKFGPKLGRLAYEWVTFFWKIGICMGLLSNSMAARPYHNKTWVSPQASTKIKLYSAFKKLLKYLKVLKNSKLKVLENSKAGPYFDTSAVLNLPLRYWTSIAWDLMISYIKQLPCSSRPNARV